jgi:hypothetical protein
MFLAVAAIFMLMSLQNWLDDYTGSPQSLTKADLVTYPSQLRGKKDSGSSSRSINAVVKAVDRTITDPESGSASEEELDGTDLGSVSVEGDVGNDDSEDESEEAEEDVDEEEEKDDQPDDSGSGDSRRMGDDSEDNEDESAEKPTASSEEISADEEKADGDEKSSAENENKPDDDVEAKTSKVE